MATIRKDSLKRIRAMLESAALITRYYDDGCSDTENERISADQLMALADSFRSVTTEHVTIHSNHFYSIYYSIEDARRRLTARAFAKYFGSEQVAA